MLETTLQSEGRQVAALPWRVRQRRDLEILLVTSRASRHWLIPKGWPMSGKSDREAALQEAYEEAGVRGTASTHRLGTYHFQKAMHDGSELPCIMSVYGMSDVVELEAWPEMEQRDRLWVNQMDALDMIFDWNLARFVAELTLSRAGQIIAGRQANTAMR